MLPLSSYINYLTASIRDAVGRRLPTPESKVLVTFSSSNPIAGPTMVTTSPRSTCPVACPLRKSIATQSLCYAEHGHLGGFIWSGLDRNAIGSSFGNGIRIYSLKQLLVAIRLLVPGSVWRHNQAGDLAPDAYGDIDRKEVLEIAHANSQRKGFTFTHHDVISNLYNRRTVELANAAGFRVNLSANDVAHADRLFALGVAPDATIIRKEQTTNFTTPAGNLVVVCPARNKVGITCSTCKLCTRNRSVIVGLPELNGNNDIYAKRRAHGAA
jgi:hypothetical protein